MGSLGTRKAAPLLPFGQAERLSGDMSHAGETVRPRLAGRSRLFWCGWSISAHAFPSVPAAHGSLPSGRRHGRPSQAVDPAQDRGEQHPRHRHHGQLEHEVAAVPHDPGAELLLFGAILAPAKRTVTSLLRIVGLSRERRFTNYHRILNRAVWAPRVAARLLLGLLVDAFAPNGPSRSVRARVGAAAAAPRTPVCGW